MPESTKAPTSTPDTILYRSTSREPGDRLVATITRATDMGNLVSSPSRLVSTMIAIIPEGLAEDNNKTFTAVFQLSNRGDPRSTRVHLPKESIAAPYKLDDLFEAILSTVHRYNDGQTVEGTITCGGETATNHGHQPSVFRIRPTLALGVGGPSTDALRRPGEPNPSCGLSGFAITFDCGEGGTAP